jgi:hypothetical protein
VLFDGFFYLFCEEAFRGSCVNQYVDVATRQKYRTTKKNFFFDKSLTENSAKSEQNKLKNGSKIK